MKKYKYLKISKTKKLRYIDNYYRKTLYIIFLPGFMSDVEGLKPQTLKRFAVKKKLGYLALEYLGHGKSSGEFTKGNISIWTSNVKILIKKGHEVLIQSNGGYEAGFTNEDYKNAGAKIIDNAEEIFKRSEIIVKVKDQ